MPPTDFTANVSFADDGIIVVALRGDVDLAVSPIVRNLLAAAGSGAQIVRLDMKAVTFLDSSGLAAMTTYGRELADAGGRLQIGDRSYLVDRVLEISGLRVTNDCFEVV